MQKNLKERMQANKEASAQAKKMNNRDFYRRREKELNDYIYQQSQSGSNVGRLIAASGAVLMLSKILGSTTATGIDAVAIIVIFLFAGIDIAHYLHDTLRYSARLSAIEEDEELGREFDKDTHYEQMDHIAGGSLMIWCLKSLLSVVMTIVLLIDIIITLW